MPSLFGVSLRVIGSSYVLKPPPNRSAPGLLCTYQSTLILDSKEVVVTPVNGIGQTGKPNKVPAVVGIISGIVLSLSPIT